MIEGINYIGNTPSKEGTNLLYSYNPADGSAYAEPFAVATEDEINQAVARAKSAFEGYKALSSENRADFIDAIAEEIMNLGDELIERASGESGLPAGRIQGERGRTCNQLKMFANLVREGSWVNAIIDTAIPDREPIPKPDLRKIQVPIGPVVVFGASNFPLAFSTAGGDTASALAAGNPVIVKGHESHLGTNELISQAIITAAQKTGMPDGVFSMVNGGIPAGQQLAKHPDVKAIGFTGSLRGGRALFDIASQREEPIPVYAEMGSINPTFLFPEKLAEDPEGLGKTLAGSVTLGVGQFCTNPGLLVGIKSEALDKFNESLGGALLGVSGTMLNEKIAKGYHQTKTDLMHELGTNGSAKHEGNLGHAATAKVSAKKFIKNPKLHEEVFGPFTLLVECENKEEMAAVAKSLHGQLTGTMIATENDLTQNETVVSAVEARVGRILFNGVPTGVEVCPAMHHGGPYPASTDAKFTSVGTDAIYRFTRPVCYQNWPDGLLPAELKEGNPAGIWRLVNGERTKS